MPHNLTIRAKAETYSAHSMAEIDLSAKLLDNGNVHRLLKPGTCCENELDETCVCCFDALLIFRELNSRLYMILK